MEKVRKKNEFVYLCITVVVRLDLMTEDVLTKFYQSLTY